MFCLITMALVSCDYQGDSYGAQPTKEDNSVFVKVARLQQQTVELTKSYYGKLRFSKHMSYVAEMGGRVSALNIKPGMKVRKGQVLCAFPPINHHLQVEQLRLEYEDLNKNYSRQQKLFKKGAVSRMSVDQLKTQKDIQEKALKQLKRVNRITAPFDGTVTEVFINRGQEVIPGAVLFSMVGGARPEVEFFVPAKKIAAIQPGGKAILKFKGRQIIGEIVQKAIQMDESKKAFRVLAAFPPDSELNISGVTVEVEVMGKVLTNAILIPTESIREVTRHQVVFLIEDNVAKQREITSGQKIGLQTLVTDGLRSGDQLIVAGVEKVENNDPVTIIN